MEQPDTAIASAPPSVPTTAEEKPISTPAPTETLDNPAEATATNVDPVDEAGQETAPPSGPQWPALAETHPLYQLHLEVPALLAAANHDEVYGITLKPKAQGVPADFHTLLILQKFLRANANNVELAKDQLAKTLAWRKSFDPLKAMNETFSKDKFDGLGYVTMIDSKELEGRKDVVTWNIYGAVKDNEKTFVPVDEFLRWRIALMELSVSKLALATIKTPIPDHGAGPDPYQGTQVHDYLNVSFLRMDKRIKAASKQTIDILSAHYPETLSRKFFVNVPLLMQWMFRAMQLLVKKETMEKFVVLSYGSQVAGQLGPRVSKEYGGESGALAEVGETLKLVAEEPQTTEELLATEPLATEEPTTTEEPPKEK